MNTQLIHTCIFTIIPSPLDPLRVAVTTTRVSFDTKFRMHLSDFLSWCGYAWRSNLSASAQAKNNRKLQSVCTSDREIAMVELLSRDEYSFSKSCRVAEYQSVTLSKILARSGNKFVTCKFATPCCANFLKSSTSIKECSASIPCKSPPTTISDNAIMPKCKCFHMRSHI